MSEESTIINNINLVLTHPYGRAGSLFIHSLFDSHPNIITLPRCGVLHSLLPKSVPEVELDSRIDAIIAKCPGIFDSSKDYFGNMSGIVTGRFGFDGEENIVISPAEFKKKFLQMAVAELDANKQISRRSFFVLIHIAYGQCVRALDISQCKFIFYHPHSNDEWNALIEDFPGLYFIAMTRDPRQDWVSWKKIHSLRMGRDTSNIPNISRFLSAKYYADSCHSLYQFIGKLKQNHVRFVDLEAFHVLNRIAMSHFCDWLGIEFDDILMNSTFNGHKWYGNAADLKKASTFNPSIKRGAWRDELTEEEVEAINKILPGTISYLRYEIDTDKYKNQPFETLHDSVKYDNSLLLIVHCFLQLAGNPLVVFPGIETQYPMSQRVERRVRNILKMSRTVPYSINLSGQLKGERLNNMLSTLAANESRLLQDRLPGDLFIDHYVSDDTKKAEHASPESSKPMQFA